MMRSASIFVSVFLGGCSGNAMSDFSKAAEKLNQSGHECSRDVRQIEFVESKQCVQFASLYNEYLAAKAKADDSPLSTLMTEKFERTDNRALHGVIAYSWALTGLGLTDPRAFQNYFDEKYVKELHRRSGKKFRTRTPVPKM